MRAWILPIAGLALMLYANVKIDAACRCGGEPAWVFALLSLPAAPGARALVLTLALGIQIGLCLAVARNRYLQIAVVLGIVALLTIPDMSLLAANKARPFSDSEWREALASRDARVTLVDFFALFLNLVTALYRSNAYIFSKI